MAQDESPQPESRPGQVRIRCGQCEGTGTRAEPRMAQVRDVSGSMVVPVRCRDCKGTGTCGWMTVPRY